MTVVVIALAGLLTILLGRWMFGGWFNHVVLYGVSWGASLALFHVGLIRYYPLESETWLVIVAGWLAFLLGSASIVAARHAFARVDEPAHSPVSRTEPRAFTVLLWILNGVILAEALRHAFVISTLIGGLTNFNRVANVLYSLRVKQEIPGMIPYLSSTGLAACLLAGVYASRKGRLQVITVLPLLVTIVDSVLNMSRGTMMIGALLFASGYTVGRSRFRLPGRSVSVNAFRRVLAIASAFLFTAKKSQKLTDIMVFGHIVVVVGMSVFLLATQWGYWLVSLLFGLAVGSVIDHYYVGENRSGGRHQLPL